MPDPVKKKPMHEQLVRIAQKDISVTKEDPLQEEDPVPAEGPGADQEVTRTAPTGQMGTQEMAQLRDSTGALIGTPRHGTVHQLGKELSEERLRPELHPWFRHWKKRPQELRNCSGRSSSGRTKS